MTLCFSEAFSNSWDPASLALIQSTLQPGLLIAMSYAPNRLRREMHNPSHHGRGLSPPSTAPRQWPGAPPEPVESRPGESRGLLSDLPGTSETRWDVLTYPSIGQNILGRKCIIASFHAVRDLAGISEIAAAFIEAGTRPNGLRNLLNRVATRATKHMHSVWKEHRTIRIELAPNGPCIDASVKDEYNLYDFSRRSDGFKRFVTFLLMVSARVKSDQLVDTLYLHDEPDVSLHPRGLVTFATN